MAVAGVPDLHDDPVRAACDAALEIRDASCRLSEMYAPQGWNIRIGIHAGPLIAGVIGKQKFSYDVWGATVNFASRMESAALPATSTSQPTSTTKSLPSTTGNPAAPNPSKTSASPKCTSSSAKKTWMGSLPPDPFPCLPVAVVASSRETPPASPAKTTASPYPPTAIPTASDSTPDPSAMPPSPPDGTRDAHLVDPNSNGTTTTPYCGVRRKKA